MSDSLRLCRIELPRWALVVTASVTAIAVAAIIAPVVQLLQMAVTDGAIAGFRDAAPDMMAPLGVEPILPARPAKGAVAEAKDAFVNQLARKSAVAVGKSFGHVSGPIFRAWADAFTH